jgi:hypothetical protein
MRFPHDPGVGQGEGGIMTTSVRSVFIVTALCVGSALSAWGEQRLSLEQAQKEGKASVEISGMGASTGDAILIGVRRNVRETLRLHLEPGTVFQSRSGSAQNMVAVCIQGEMEGPTTYSPASEIVLSDDRRHSYVARGCCVDLEKSNPSDSDGFTISAVDGRLKAICEMGSRRGVSVEVLQAAIWLDREGACAESIKARFPVNDGEIESARALLAALEDQERERILQRQQATNRLARSRGNAPPPPEKDRADAGDRSAEPTDFVPVIYGITP